MNVRLLPTLSVITLFILAGCGGGGGSGSGTVATGQLRLGVTDAPLEAAQRVVIAFTGFQLIPEGEGAPMEIFVFDESSCDDFDAATGTCSIDLLTLIGDTRKVVFNGEIPAGHYSQIRLLVQAERNVMDSFIELVDGTSCPIWIPSGAQTGLKIVNGITVTANGISDYTLDFDVRSSIAVPPGLSFHSTEACNQNYLLKPAIRVVDTTETGTLAGTVSETLLETSETDGQGCQRNAITGAYDNAVVYIFENFDGMAVADDIDLEDGNDNPITTASVVYDAENLVYGYEAGFLLSPEDYLVALTCTAGIDMPDTDEYDPTTPETTPDFSFIAEQLVTTISGNTADASFE